jgi:PncC family amidohydrolase
MSPCNQALETEVGRLLLARGWWLAVAESCTGGLVGHRLTCVSGSSAYFLGGVIAYANAVKVDQLGVEPAVLDREGAVSAPVAGQMARGVSSRFGADIGIGITGIAGPGGGREDKPVGLVFIGLAEGGACRVESFRFSGSRIEIKRAAAEAALEMLVNQLTD